jgi:dipeptidyl aminopeptidase/acylaminoacyl peptidase
MSEKTTVQLIQFILTYTKYNQMKKMCCFLLAIICVGVANAQDAIGYQTPPKDIYDLAVAKPTPGVSVNSKGTWMLIQERSDMPTVEDLAQPELRIAGLRINPKNFGPSRSGYITNLTLKNIATGKEVAIKNLPKNLKASNISWNIATDKFAFTNATLTGIDLYVVSLQTFTAVRWNNIPVNAVLGSPYSWITNSSILFKAVTKPLSQQPQKPVAPAGPVVQQNLGKVAASRTYQDLIKSPYDEALFEFYATTQLVRATESTGGTLNGNVGSPAIIGSYELSPSNQYILAKRIDKPFSYLVPAGGFNNSMLIMDIVGKEVKLLAKIPSSELTPTGFDNVLNAPHDFTWKDDEPATVMWVTPLDSGIMKKKMDFHDEAFALAAPFTANPVSIAKTGMRIYDVSPVKKDMIMVTEGSQAKRRQKTSMFNPADGSSTLLFDRSTDDAYTNPGRPLTDKNEYGRDIIKLINGNKLMLSGMGASPKGDLPFLNLYNISTKETQQLWRCEEPFYEVVADVLDYEKMLVLTSKQSQTEAPNYYIRDLKNNTAKAITNFPDPQPVLRSVSKQKISYKRKDGVDLAADLYLPKGYDAKKDGPLPVIMWAYPREFKSANDAAQVRGSKHTFTRISWGSPIFWVTQGYAVMDNTEFPIVGEGDNQPNDNFIEQLEWNARAAINKVAEMGVGDSTRVGVGGHSYGAFMTANLLAHTNLFKAGVARSGAYNRTLTPFGFQNEERTYWQAPDVYNRMSPFSHADKIKTPLLLIHGEADNNPGTFPIQSERLFNAVKGHGGTVRFVQLPFESHGYAAKENILHMLWEMNTWIDKYVKNKGAAPSKYVK